MADRSTFNGASSEVPWKNTAGVPEGFGDQYARHIKTLYDASALPLTSVGGTAANVTSQVDPAITGGMVDGMKFTITWASDSTGPTTLKIGTLAAAPVVDDAGGALIAGSVKAGQRSLLEFVGGSFRLLGGASGSGMQGRFYFQFTASGTWTKPAGLDPDTMVLIEVWGGGGSANRVSGGANRCPGAGGGYSRVWVRYGDIPAAVAVVIGAGGVAPPGNGDGSPGGTSSVGTLASATGGQKATATGAIGGGWVGFGAPGSTSATHDFGGAGANPGGPSNTGGNAVYGGASGNGGVSLYGGNGGNIGQPGQAPGGGGGRMDDSSPPGNGARGEARIWIL